MEGNRLTTPHTQGDCFWASWESMAWLCAGLLAASVVSVCFVSSSEDVDH